VTSKEAEVITRREFMRAGTAGSLLLIAGRRLEGATLLAGMMDSAAITKYVTPLAVPPVMPSVSTAADLADRYLIGVRQFRQQILPPGSPATTVWGYGSIRHPRTFSSPGLTVEATIDRPILVMWVNELTDRYGDHLPHLLPVDPTLHWANPPGGAYGRDSRPAFTSTPGRYEGPVPIVTHLHGGDSSEDSDGYPEAWYLPRAKNIPSGYVTEGSQYAAFAESFEARGGVSWRPGAAVFRYDNDQRATTMWYHDHALG
jgi:spore coat protein A, manganese oxidase